MSLRASPTLALACGLVAWYRFRVALPRPLGGHSLLLRRLEAWTDEGAAGQDAVEARRLAELFRRAVARGPIAASCIARSLALARLLRLHGLRAGLRIGWRGTCGSVAGHAWVEHGGVAVAEDEAFVRTFHPLCLTGRPRAEAAS